MGVVRTLGIFRAASVATPLAMIQVVVNPVQQSLQKEESGSGPRNGAATFFNIGACITPYLQQVSQCLGFKTHVRILSQ